MSVEQLSQLFTRKTSELTMVLVLNEMTLMLDRPTLRVEYEYCPSGGVRVRKPLGVGM